MSGRKNTRRGLATSRQHRSYRIYRTYRRDTLRNARELLYVTCGGANPSR